jgi:hypothetical protein
MKRFDIFYTESQKENRSGSNSKIPTPAGVLEPKRYLNFTFLAFLTVFEAVQLNNCTFQKG